MAKVTAPNGKIYDINTSGWKYSFASQWAEWWQKSFGSLSEAINAINAGNPKTTATAAIGWANALLAPTKPVVKKTTAPSAKVWAGTVAPLPTTPTTSNKNNTTTSVVTTPVATTWAGSVLTGTVTPVKVTTPAGTPTTPAASITTTNWTAPVSGTTPIVTTPTTPTITTEPSTTTDTTKIEEQNQNAIKLNSLNTRFWADLANISDEDGVLLMIANPEKYQEYLQAKKDQFTLSRINWDTTETITPTETTGVDSLLASMWISYNSVEHTNLASQYQEQYNKTVQPLSAEMLAAKAEVDKYKNSYDNTLASLRKQYGWTGATDTYIRALAAKKQEDELPQYQNAIDNYNNAMTAYNWAMASLDKNMSLQVQQSQLDAQEFNQKLSLYNAARNQQYQKAQLVNAESQLEAGKYSAVSDGMGWVTVYNTKTGEIQNNSSTNTDTTAYKSAWGNLITNLERTGNNVGADTNNFGNITSPTSGSIGMYKSPNGRSYAVYATAQDGYNALVNDLKAKQSGNTKTGLNANSTAQQLLTTWVGSGVQQSYLNGAANAGWFKLTDKIWNISTDKLAKGIMAAEWTLAAYNAWWKNLSQYKAQWTPQVASTDYSPWAMSYMDKLSGQLTTENLKILKTQFWLNADDVAAYKASKAISGTDYESALKWLSPAAQSIVMGKDSLANYGMVAKAKIKDELANSWISDYGMWNQQFWSLNNKDQEWLRSYVQIWNRLNIINEVLKGWENTGIWKNAGQRVKNALWLPIDTTYNQLKMAAWKNLVEYIKSISGTAVSESERAMLQQLLPNAATMSTSKFKDALRAFQREYESLLDSKVTQYGFDSVNALQTQMWLASYGLSGTSSTSLSDSLKKLLWQ